MQMDWVFWKKEIELTVSVNESLGDAIEVGAVTRADVAC
jgi:hypothetical protein